jgi:membrane fusion protein, epimerase transport system
MTEEKNLEDGGVLNTDDQQVKMFGLVIIFITFVVFGGWASLAPLSSAALAPGVIVVKSNRKTVQHFEGGIIEKVWVKDGDIVKKGGFLITLDGTQVKAKIEGLKRLKESKLGLVASFQEELADLKELLVEGYVDKNRFRDVERRYLQTLGEIDDLESTLITLKDRSKRLQVVAPVSGVVMQMQLHTVGGVISPGEPVLEIVPQKEVLIVEAQVSPNDIDRVTIGLLAEVRLSAFSRGKIPTLEGKLITLSADRLIDEGNHLPYYLTRVELTPESISKLEGIELLPGMPAEVLINTGSRTLVEYLVQPLTNVLSKSLIED